MTLRSGLAIQCGYAVEATPGAPVTPTLFLPVTDLPSVVLDSEATESDGIIATRTVLTSDQWNGANIKVGGDVGHELYDHGLDVLLRACMGSMVQSGAGPYTHVHAPGALDDDALTVQYGVPSVASGVIPATFGGCHVASWEIGFAKGAIGTLGVTFAGMNGGMGSRSVASVATTNASPTITGTGFMKGDVGKVITGTGIPAGARVMSVNAAGTSATITANATATGTTTVVIGMPLATATYPTALKPLKAMHASVSIGGLPVPVESMTVSGDNGLADDRYIAGSQWPLQPIEAGLRTYTGKIDAEFATTGVWELFRNGAEAAVQLQFARGANTLTIDGNARFDANAPTGNGRGIVGQSIPIEFIASGATDDTAIKITTVNQDNVT